MRNTIHKMRFILMSFLIPAFSAAQTPEHPSPPAGYSLPTLPQTTYDPNLHLLVDPEAIVESNGTTIYFPPPDRLPEPVLVSSWTPYRMATAWGNVIREPNGLFRMWYLDMSVNPHDQATRKVWGEGADYGYYPKAPGDYRDVDQAFICYAESWDGIHWTKPPLGLFEFDGSKNNNIVYAGHHVAEKTNRALSNMDGCSVIRDDKDPDPNKRYKMFAYWETVHKYDNSASKLDRPAEDIKRFRKAAGHFVCHSPDGIHFGDLEPSGLPFTGRDRNCVMPDPKRNQFRAFIRPDIDGTEKVPFIRAVGLCSSADLRQWSDLETIFVPDELDDFGAVNIFHSFIPFNYGSEDLGFAFICSTRGLPGETYLACLQQNGTWKRLYRDKPFLTAGGPGSFDRDMAVPLHNEPILVGDQMYIYYAAASRTPNHPAGSRSIGLARYRRDAFVGIAGGVTKIKSKFETQQEASFLTRPFTVSAPNLSVNVEGGALRIALLDENKSPIPGFTLDDCIPISADSIRAPVTWKNNPDLTPLLGKKVAIHAAFTYSVIYAFKFYDPPKP